MRHRRREGKGEDEPGRREGPKPGVRGAVPDGAARRDHDRVRDDLQDKEFKLADVSKEGLEFGDENKEERKKKEDKLNAEADSAQKKEDHEAAKSAAYGSI